MSELRPSCSRARLSAINLSSTLEDEGGIINVMVWGDLAERQGRELLGSRLMAVDGKWKHVNGIEHLIASRLHDLRPLLGALDTRSRDFR